MTDGSQPAPVLRRPPEEVVQECDWNILEPKDIAAELRKRFDDKQQDEAQKELEEIVRAYHKHTTERWELELDALLVYAALFSGILTAFNIESYHLLQPDATQLMVAALSDVSDRFSDLAWNAPTPLGTAIHRPRVSREDSLPFNPPRFVIVVNCLWFSSLVTSLVSASIALLVKQWIYENKQRIAADLPSSTPQLPQHRINTFKQWRVHGIITLVPLLLQLALIIFLVGLVILLWNLHTVVAAVTSALTGIFFIFLITVTVLPAYRWSCWYRSPQALLVYRVVRAIRNRTSSGLKWASGFCTVRLLRRPESRPLSSWWYFLRRCCEYLSEHMIDHRLVGNDRTWQTQELDDLRARRQGGALKTETAVAAYTVTLDLACLEWMPIVLAGEPNLPLLRCLNTLGIARVVDRKRLPEALPSEPFPVSLSWLLRQDRYAQAMLSMLRYALCQMLAVERVKRFRRAAGSGREGRFGWTLNRGSELDWEDAVQALFNSYNFVQGSIPPVPYDDFTLRTVFLILRETENATNRSTALRYLEHAMHVDEPMSCDYSTVSHVQCGVAQWISEQQADRCRDTPDIHMIAFSIVIHCMVCAAEGKIGTSVPQFKSLCDRARTALPALPEFLPQLNGLLENKELCDKLAFGLSLVLLPLARLSQASDRRSLARPDIASLWGDIPSPIHEGLFVALEDAWDTAWAVIAPRSIRRQRARCGSMTERLEALRQDVASTFPKAGGPMVPLPV